MKVGRTHCSVIILFSLLVSVSAVAAPAVFGEKTVPQMCKVEGDLLAEQVSAYGKSLINKDHFRAGSQLAAIRKKVKDTTENPKEVCSDYLLERYLLASLALSESHLFGLASQWTQNLAEILINNGKIKWVRPDLRRLWSGLWDRVKTDSNGKPHPMVYASYDCQSSVIYIDPDHSPFDLASILNHELAHLIRDKYDALVDYDNSEVKPNRRLRERMNFSKTSLQDALLMDEVFSTLSGAFVQIRMLDRFGSKKEPFLGPARTEFDFTEDLTFFDRQGPLFHIWESRLFRRKKSPSPLAKRVYSYQRWDDRSSLLNFVQSLGKGPFFQEDSRVRYLNNLNMELIQSDLEEIASRVASTYFVGEVQAGAEFRKKAFDWSWTFPNNFRVDPISKLYQDWDSLYVFSELQKRLNEKSVSCRAIERSLYQGGNAGYFGEKLFGVDGNRPGVDGNRPGVDGNRPGVDGNRPGVDGNRPGVDGNRPGVDGNRPGVDGNRPSLLSRPCLHPDQAP